MVWETKCGVGDEVWCGKVRTASKVINISRSIEAFGPTLFLRPMARKARLSSALRKRCAWRQDTGGGYGYGGGGYRSIGNRPRSRRRADSRQQMERREQLSFAEDVQAQHSHGQVAVMVGVKLLEELGEIPRGCLHLIG